MHCVIYCYKLYRFHFTIHGLWPNYKDGGWPEFCDSENTFDESKIEDLKEQMEEEWPSFMGNNDDAVFWKHEWEKHGTCATDVLPDEHKYFKTVLKLHYRYNLEVCLFVLSLASNRITPS